MPEIEDFSSSRARCRVAVIWIDWYAYHIARFRGLNAAPMLAGRVAGLELVGGVGVHAGLKFREDLPPELAIETLEPESNWAEVSKFRLAHKLWTRLSELDPELVLVPGYYTLPAVAAALWARLHHSASVLMTESTAYDHPRVAWKEWAKGLLLRVLFDWAVTGGQEHRAYLDQLSFPAGRSARFYDVVDNQFFAEGTDALRDRSPAEFGLPDEPYFVYVGRFAEEKNVSQLLDSWILYRRGGGTWPLVLVGDGPLASSLRESAAASGFGSEVYLPGLKSSRSLVPYYAFAGCFVLPSTREPWGLVVNEAMASGLPVLVSDRCGCAADLVEQGRNGFVFDPADGQALIARMHQISSLSSAELHNMRSESRRLIHLYSPQNFGLEIARIAEVRKAELRDPMDLREPEVRAAGSRADRSMTSHVRGSQ